MLRLAYCCFPLEGFGVAVLFVRRRNRYRSVSGVPFAAEEWLIPAVS